MSAVCIIPARGGSKRIARKNIKPFCGQPMLAYSIQAALASHCFDRVVVSTDDDEIATLARACGAEVPFVRPAALADDHTGTTAVVKHALQWLAAHHNTANLDRRRIGRRITHTATHVRVEREKHSAQQHLAVGGLRNWALLNPKVRFDRRTVRA